MSNSDAVKGGIYLESIMVPLSAVISLPSTSHSDATDQC